MNLTGGTESQGRSVFMFVSREREEISPGSST